MRPKRANPRRAARFIDEEASVSREEGASGEEGSDGDAVVSRLIDDGDDEAGADEGAARWRFMREQASGSSPEVFRLPTPARAARYRAELRANVRDTPPDDDFEGGRARACGGSESESGSMDSFICDDSDPVSFLPSTAGPSV